MKNLLNNLTLIVAAGILFTSCGTKWSLTKRHYRNGYHVEHAGKQLAQTSKFTEHSEKRIPVRVSEQRINPIAENEMTANVNSVTQPVQSVAVKPVSHKHSVLSMQRFTSKIETAVNKPKVILKNKIQKLTVAGDDEGRSFFWTIILLLILIWAIAFFLGGIDLGGLIHLLLIIALVFFILWLLRII
jgi:hypothetical protein